MTQSFQYNLAKKPQRLWDPSRYGVLAGVL